MITSKIVVVSIIALLGYAIYQVGTASDSLTATQVQQPACAAQECATAFDVPPSSSLFL